MLRRHAVSVLRLRPSLVLILVALLYHLTLLLENARARRLRADRRLRCRRLVKMRLLLSSTETLIGIQIGKLVQPTVESSIVHLAATRVRRSPLQRSYLFYA